MTMKYGLQTSVLLSLVLVSRLFSLTTGESFNETDHRILMPAFFTHDIREGLTGTIKLNLEFDGGSVKAVKVVSSDMHSRTGFVTEFPSLVETSIEGIVRDIKEWHSSRVDPFLADLIVELKVDPTLPVNARNYRIEFGKAGVVAKLVISGPFLEKSPPPPSK